MTKAIRGAGSRTIRRGPWHAAKWMWHHIYERYRERQLGIETARFDEWKGSIENDACHDYEPLSYRCIEKALQLIDVQPTDVFLDYGSGKGRAVITAARLPFRRVIGIELLESLCEQARANFRRASKKLHCQHAEFIAAEASSYELPDDVSLIYLYNPFWDEVMGAVQRRIHESLTRVPRKLTITYLFNPGQFDSFAKLDWLHCALDRPEMWENVRCVIYEHRPEVTNK